jgi:hypothetical protein
MITDGGVEINGKIINAKNEGEDIYIYHTSQDWKSHDDLKCQGLLIMPYYFFDQTGPII